MLHVIYTTAQQAKAGRPQEWECFRAIRSMEHHLGWLFNCQDALYHMCVWGGGGG